MSWAAYVDESVRTLEGVYVLAAAVLDELDQSSTRERVAELALRGLPFHWRLELPHRRSTAVALVAELATLQVVVVGFPMVPAKQERARRYCLQELLFHLEAAGVEQVWLESRNALLDGRDLDVVSAFRARKVISGKIRVDHARPSIEPLLWIPDIVAGAVSTAEAGQFAYRARLESILVEHRIQLS